MKKHRFIKMVSVVTALVLLCPAALAATRARAASDNETAVFDYLTAQMGLNEAAACGVLANIEIESGFNPHAGGDEGTSYGICQWHASRFTRLRNYCSDRDLDYTTLYGQLCYLNYELENYYPRVLGCLQDVSNTAQGAYEAGYYWCYYFEIPAGYASGVSVSRGNRAMNVYWPVYEPPAELTAAEKAAVVSEKNPAALQRIFTRMADMFRSVLSIITKKG